MLGTILGGVGLFLLGMSLLTEGLQAVAGDALRNGLRRFTKHRLSAVITGAIATAAVQSSSATTLLCIGFVGAGLLSFPAALGVVFGANFGTTMTTWLVAAVGLKLKIDYAALPLVGLGALLKLFTRGRRQGYGAALAGFGLLFVGIGLLQQGMASLASMVDVSRIAGSGLGTQLLLVGIGVVMTVVMQSSSAAVATTLAAVDAQAIDLSQAAALVVGQNVGTTVTAIIGALGGSAAVKRTAYAHTIFNVGTGAVALALLPLFEHLVTARAATQEPAIAISVFHSAFNLLGILLFVPFIPRLAATLERLVPEEGAELTRRLRVGRAGLPDALLEAARKTTRDIARELVAAALPLLRHEADALPEATDKRLSLAITTCREALEEVRTDPQVPHQYRAHVATLHALDHLARLLEALGESTRIATVAEGALPGDMAARLAPAYEQLALWLESDEGPPPPIDETSRGLASARRRGRPETLAATALAALSSEAAEERLEAMRWVDRLGYHAWRATHHLIRAREDPGLASAPAPESQGRRGDESYAVRS